MTSFYVPALQCLRERRKVMFIIWLILIRDKEKKTIHSFETNTENFGRKFRLGTDGIVAYY